MTDLLDQISQNLNSGQDAQKLWDILCALRGPDMEESKDPYQPPTVSDRLTKFSTTGVLRFMLLSRTNVNLPDSMSIPHLIENTKLTPFLHGKKNGSIYNTDNPQFAAWRRDHTYFSGQHFWIHARAAFRALDLKWTEVNNDYSELIAKKAAQRINFPSFKSSCIEMPLRVPLNLTIQGTDLS